MKHTSRALLAVALLVGVYVLAFGIAAAFVGIVVFAFKEHAGAAGLKFAIIGGLVIAALARGVFASLRRTPDDASGVELTEQDQPRLWAEVTSLSEQLGVRRPDEIRLIPAVNAAVSENSHWLGLVPGRRRMYIGVPLLTGLTELQLRSVLAHELGHYSGRHTALSGVTYRGLEAIRRMIANLGEGFVAKVIELYGRLYVAVSHSVNRAQEFEADAFSAKVAGRGAAIAAMRELPVIGQAWDFYLRQYASIGQDRQQRPQELLAGFQQLLDHPARRDQLEEVRAEAADTKTSRYDSHPSTADRIRAFEALPDDGRLDETGPAIAVLDNPAATLQSLEAWMFEGSDLRPVTWDQLVHDAGVADAAETAKTLRHHLAKRGVPSPDLAYLVSQAGAGQAAALVSGLLDDSATPAQHRGAAAHAIEQTIADLAVRHCGAAFRVDFGGPLRLVDRDGLPLEPRPLVDTAVEEHDTAPLEAWLHEHGVPLSS